MDISDTAIFYLNPAMPITFKINVMGLGDTKEAGKKSDIRRNHSLILIRMEIQEINPLTKACSIP